MKHDTLDGIFVQLEIFRLPCVREKKKKVHYKCLFRTQLFLLVSPVHKELRNKPYKATLSGKVNHQFWWVSKKWPHGISSPTYLSVFCCSSCFQQKGCNIKDETHMQLAWKESSTGSISPAALPGRPTLHREGHFHSLRSNPAKPSASQCRSHVPVDALS